MVTRSDVEFPAEDGIMLRGWLFTPAAAGKHPAISMCHGFAAVKEHGLEPFARAFAQAGFVVLVHDHRNFGASDGAPRHNIDPMVQVADWRVALSNLAARPEVDPEAWHLGQQLQRWPCADPGRDRPAGEMRGVAGADHQRL